MQKNWLQRLLKGQQRYRQFMTGRYGYFDQLNKVLLVISLLLFLLRHWLPVWLGALLPALALGLLCYRYFSKRIYVRSNENQKFLAFWEGLSRRRSQSAAAGKQWQKAKRANISHVVFACEHCGQSLRVPQGKGKIKVTCKNCGHQFVKNV